MYVMTCHGVANYKRCRVAASTNVDKNSELSTEIDRLAFDPPPLHGCRGLLFVHLVAVHLFRRLFALSCTLVSYVPPVA